MKPYPAYKDSGIEWIGEIPEHWAMRKISHSFNMIGSGTTPKADNPEYYDYGNINWIITGDLNDSILKEASKKITHKALEDYSSLKTYPKGTLLIAMYGATIGKIAMLDIEGCTNQACCALSDSHCLTNKFTFYWFIANKPNIISLSVGGGQPNISQEIIRSLRIPTPTLLEQESIIKYLNHKTSQIDTLIEKKQKQIELLKEERTAIINQAVTKGLNPDVPMKDSGIEWLGEVPEHWEIMKLKYASNIFFSNVDKKTNDGETIVRSCNYVDVYNNEVITEDINFLNISATKSEISKFLIKEGDVLATKDSETPDDIAVPALVKCSFTDVVCGYHLAIIRPLSIIGEYLFRLLQSEINYHFFIQAKGITRFGLSTDSFNNLLIPLPPMSEQLDIILHIKEKLSVSESLIDKIQNQITLLQEYRTALISNAVTGKIDVRDTPTAILE